MKPSAMHPPVQAGAPASAPTEELVAFWVAGQEFAFEISAVREIRGWTQTTPLAQAPPHGKGVVNLRGVALPILDLAELLGFAPLEPTTRHAIIVAEIGTYLVGLLVEGLSEIMRVAASEVQPTPEIGHGASGGGGRTCVRGLIAAEARMISILDLARMFPPAPETQLVA